MLSNVSLNDYQFDELKATVTEQDVMSRHCLANRLAMIGHWLGSDEATEAD